MSSRLYSRLLQLALIGLKLPSKVVRRKPADNTVKRILVIHQLLLGDALMATGLLANLRAKYPEAELDVAMPAFLVRLYQNKPYNINPMAYSPKDASSLARLFRQDTYDMAYVIGDARYSWAAFAAGARWIVTHDGDYPAYKNWFVDEQIPMPNHIKAMPDLMIDLCSPEIRASYNKVDWVQPDIRLGLPDKPYVILHVGASSSLKLWACNHWEKLAEKLSKSGYAVVVTCGPGEESLVKTFYGNDCVNKVVPGNYSLLEMWKLIDNAELLVSPDTGISHVAKVTNTPLVCIFGPGPYELVGDSVCFNKHQGIYISKPIHCRDQPVIFKRPVSWLKFCERREGQCNDAKCIRQIEFGDVFKACTELLR